MRSENEQPSDVGSSTFRELRLLSEVEQNPEVTQRDLSRRVGVALGLTNVLLRNLVQKGYVRVTRAGWKRFIYNLTPKGVTHKLNLTVAYIHRVLNHYRSVRRTLSEQLEPLALNEESRVAIYGPGEFAELVYLGLKELGIEEIDIFSQNSAASAKFLGMRVQDVTEIRPEEYDTILVALLDNSSVSGRQLRELGVPGNKVITFFGNGPARKENQR